MSTTTLKTAVRIAQKAVPLQVCYIVPVDAPSDMLTAIFKESYERWGGRETLIIPMLDDGSIDEAYWSWARNIDPDLVYSYVALDVPMLERIDRELMPCFVSVHRSDLLPENFNPRHEHEARGLSSISLLPMLASMDRLGPLRRPAIIGAYPEWTQKPDLFITDTFGLNPLGPGWGHAESVQRHVASIALGKYQGTMFGENANEEVSGVNELLALMCSGRFRLLTMAQLSSMGYKNVWHEKRSSWRTFNIIIGDTTLERLTFWNSRVGTDDFKREWFTAIRISKQNLEDSAFIAALALFISRWNLTENGSQHFITIRSSTVAEDATATLKEALQRQNAYVTFEAIHDVVDCCPSEDTRTVIARPGISQRFTDANVQLFPQAPAHLTDFGHVSPALSIGAWATELTIQRESANVDSKTPKFAIPRRWQAIRSVAGDSEAKPMRNGGLRLIVEKATEPEILQFTDDDNAFIARLIGPTFYRTTTDPRNAIPKRKVIYARTSASGRHLIGLLNKLGNIEYADTVLNDEFWKAAFLGLAVPRETFDLNKRRLLAQRLRKSLSRTGKRTLETEEDYEDLAETVAKVAPDLATPVGTQNFSWFLEIYRKTREGQRLLSTSISTEEYERTLRDAVDTELRMRCREGILRQGYDWRCSLCLHHNWLAVDALKPIVTCEVCRRTEPISTNFTWDFWLDGYVSLGLRERGLRGLVRALGILSGSSDDTFVFAPPLDLSDGATTLTDADIACLVGNKFVIGEVKESDRKINDGLGDQLIMLGELIRPDIIVLACLDSAAQSKVKAQTDRVSEKLRPLGIQAIPIVPDVEYEIAPSIISRRMHRHLFGNH